MDPSPDLPEPVSTYSPAPWTPGTAGSANTSEPEKDEAWELSSEHKSPPESLPSTERLSLVLEREENKWTAAYERRRNRHRRFANYDTEDVGEPAANSNTNYMWKENHLYILTQKMRKVIRPQPATVGMRVARRLSPTMVQFSLIFRRTTRCRG